MDTVTAAVAILLSPGILSAAPLDTVLVLETAPGTEQPIGLIQPKHFAEGDRAAVVVFRRSSEVILPLTADREELARALQQAGTRVNVAVSGVPIDGNPTAGLAAAIRKGCAEFGPAAAGTPKRAIVVVFASEDPGFSASADALRSTVKAANARLYAVIVPRSDARDTPYDVRPGPARYPVPITGVTPYPAVTARLISKLAKDTGGKAFTGGWSFRDILTAARK
jgi:hypothetical protein